MKKIKTVDGVDIIEDGDVTYFRVSEEYKKQEAERKALESVNKPTSFWGKIFNWFKTSKITPYAKTRDLADPTGERKNDFTDIDVGSDGKTGVEVGIKISF